MQIRYTIGVTLFIIVFIVYLNITGVDISVSDTLDDGKERLEQSPLTNENFDAGYKYFKDSNRTKVSPIVNDVHAITDHSDQYDTEKTLLRSCKEVKPARTSDSKLNILIMAEYRSGSSFTGEICKKNPDVLYIFEPLKVVKISEELTKGSEEINQAYSLILQELFQCNFTSLMAYYHKMVEDAFDMRLHRSWLWRMLNPIYRRMGMQNSTEIFSYNLTDITNPSKLSAVCQEFKHTCIKTIRLTDLAFTFSGVMNPMLEENRNVRVIYLVRDPRGIISSRMKIFQLETHTIKAEALYEKDKVKIMGLTNALCTDFNQNLNFSKELFDIQTCNTVFRYLHILRYEDLAIRKYAVLREIYTFLGIPVHQNVTGFMDSLDTIEHMGLKEINSKLKMGGHGMNIRDYKLLLRFKQYKFAPRQFYTTSKNSEKTAESWREHLPFQVAKAIDKTCENVLRDLGYESVDAQKYPHLEQSMVNKLPLSKQVSFGIQ